MTAIRPRSFFKPIVCVSLSLALFACGGSDDDDPTPPVSATPTTVPTAAPTANPEPTATPTPSPQWTMVWQDEFDGEAIDTTKWGFEKNCWGGGNNEQQCYTDRSDNAYLDGGVLKIVAQREDYTGPATPDGSPGGDATLPYTSARLRSLDKGDWTYGRFEIRAKLPAGQGTWPAIWMLPSESVYGTWAASGEIDIMEAVNLKTASDEAGAPDGTLEARVHGTLHYGETWPRNKNSGASYKLPNDVNPADDFHVYALEWEEGEIRWYADGVHYATQRDTGWYARYENAEGDMVTAPQRAPFNEKFHLLLNLAVGGAWAGAVNETGIDESAFPQMMEVDYVRVYQCNVSPSTGAGCATLGDDAELVEGNAPPVPVDPNDDYGKGPVYTLFDDGITEDLVYNSYDPDNVVTYSELSDEDRGTVLSVTKSGANGNMYFAYTPGVNLSDFANGGELVFDIQVVDMAEGTEVLIKIDSGWPSVSDTTITLPALGQWQEIRLDFDALMASGNSITPGSADITAVFNPFVVEPTGPITLLIDNVRFEEGDGGVPPNTKDQVDLPITFEDATVDYTMGDFGGATTVLGDDPTGAEGVVAITRKVDSAESWAGTTMSTAAGLANPVAVTPENSVMTVRVYSPAADIPVRLKLEDHTDGTVSVETEALTTVANMWETLSFDFTDEAAGTSPLVYPGRTYDKASIFFNFGQTGSAAGELMFYWDDIQFGN